MTLSRMPEPDRAVLDRSGAIIKDLETLIGLEGVISEEEGRRAFEADVLSCPRCGGRMTVLATIDDPAVIHRILTHLGLSTEVGEAVPAARGSP